MRVEQQTELRSLAAVSNSFYRNDVVGSGGRKRWRDVPIPLRILDVSDRDGRGGAWWKEFNHPQI